VSSRRAQLDHLRRLRHRNVDEVEAPKHSPAVYRRLLN
jgi:hypothetical protein